MDWSKFCERPALYRPAIEAAEFGCATWKGRECPLDGGFLKNDGKKFCSAVDGFWASYEGETIGAGSECSLREMVE